jgi:hypothetical protein
VIAVALEKGDRLQVADDGGHGGGQGAVADEQRRPDCCNIAAQLLHGYRK